MRRAKSGRKTFYAQKLSSGDLVAAIGFSVGSGAFCPVIFLILKTKIAPAGVWSALVWIFGFQLIQFFADSLMLRPLSLVRAGIFLNRSLGRGFLLFLDVFVGIFAALFVGRWFVPAFVVLKTIADIDEQIRIFPGFGKECAKIEVLSQTTDLSKSM